MFKGEKTLVFWIGLLVFGYSLAQFCAAIWETIYYVAIFPRVYPVTTPNISAYIEAQSIYPLVPLVISGVVFIIIGQYMMKKGVKQEQSSTQN